MTHTTIIETFHIIGIAVRTTNENGQAGHDIPALWAKFMNEGILEVIPNKIDSAIYCIYTDYEKDYTKPYTTILGCKVANLTNIPEGMIGKTIENPHYKQYIAKGNMQEGIVFDTWTRIWTDNIERAYTTDFEIYGEKSQNPADAEVDIFVAIR
jgi:predicted transcriptional regulator YdeE